MESDPKTVSFTKNGEDMGVAFEFTEELSNQALFPHVLIKNAEFVVNCGAQVTVLFPKLKQKIISMLLLVFLSSVSCVSKISAVGIVIVSNTSLVSKFLIVRNVRL